MIDIHCHILPGIDDGARDLEHSVALCRLALANGITHAVATPHIHPGRWENDLNTISMAYDALRRELDRQQIPLQLGMASEVRISPEMLQMIPEAKIPYLGDHDGYKVMLLELPHSHVPPGADKLVQWLLNNGIKPMIAHPERNKDIMRDLTKIHPFVELGCLFQVTAGAVAGRFGPQAEERALDLLERGWVTVLASDAHNEQARPPELIPGRDAAAEIVGAEQAQHLVTTAPYAIVCEKFALAA